jgi:mRNA-degrading endonuclease RelE of RelBE toxin-antitoxin system
MEFVATRLAENPQRATHALGAPFEGKNSGNVGRYRVMVRIDEATHTVHIVRVEYRGTVYQPR